jgi:hypothetical protein
MYVFSFLFFPSLHLTSFCRTVLYRRTSFSFMEVMPLPLGIVDSTSASGATVTIAGTVTPFLASSSIDNSVSIQQQQQTLVIGMGYYTNTMGQVVPSNVFYGRGVTGSVGSGFGSAEQYYVYDADTNTIVSLGSRVGIASSSSDIYISLSTSSV